MILSIKKLNDRLFILIFEISIVFFNFIFKNIIISVIIILLACVAELVDAHDSKSCDFGHVGSIPTASTIGKSV